MRSRSIAYVLLVCQLASVSAGARERAYSAEERRAAQTASAREPAQTKRKNGEQDVEKPIDLSKVDPRLKAAAPKSQAPVDKYVPMLGGDRFTAAPVAVDPAEIEALYQDMLVVVSAVEVGDNDRVHTLARFKAYVEEHKLNKDGKTGIFDPQSLKSRVDVLRGQGKETVTLDDLIGTIWQDIGYDALARNDELLLQLHEKSKELDGRKDDNASFLKRNYIAVTLISLAIGRMLWGILKGALIAGPIGGFVSGMVDPFVRHPRERAAQLTAEKTKVIWLQIAKWFNPELIPVRFYNRGARWIAAHNKAFRWGARMTGYRNALIDASEASKKKLDGLITEVESANMRDLVGNTILGKRDKYFSRGAEISAGWDSGLTGEAQKQRRIHIEYDILFPKETALTAMQFDHVATYAQDTVHARSLALTDSFSAAHGFNDDDRLRIKLEVEALRDLALSSWEATIDFDDNRIPDGALAEMQRKSEALIAQGKSEYHRQGIRDEITVILRNAGLQVRAEYAIAYQVLLDVYYEIRYPEVLQYNNADDRLLSFGTREATKRLLSMSYYESKAKRALLRILAYDRAEVDMARDQELELVGMKTGTEKDPGNPPREIIGFWHNMKKYLGDFRAWRNRNLTPAEREAITKAADAKKARKELIKLAKDGAAKGNDLALEMLELMDIVSNEKNSGHDVTETAKEYLRVLETRAETEARIKAEAADDKARLDAKRQLIEKATRLAAAGNPIAKHILELIEQVKQEKANSADPSRETDGFLERFGVPRADLEILAAQPPPAAEAQANTQKPPTKPDTMGDWVRRHGEGIMKGRERLRTNLDRDSSEVAIFSNRPGQIIWKARTSTAKPGDGWLPFNSQLDCIMYHTGQ